MWIDPQVDVQAALPASQVLPFVHIAKGVSSIPKSNDQTSGVRMRAERRLSARPVTIAEISGSLPFPKYIEKRDKTGFPESYCKLCFRKLSTINLGLR